uniref:Uncharacterized protein n=1 Tax=Solanum lycopersicum TaxID=4081 RepID=A0A494G8V0_SOLLC
MTMGEAKEALIDSGPKESFNVDFVYGDELMLNSGADQVLMVHENYGAPARNQRLKLPALPRGAILLGVCHKTEMAETKEEFEARIWAKYEAELQSKIEAMNAQEEFERKLRVKLEAEYAKKRRVIL